MAIKTSSAPFKNYVMRSVVERRESGKSNEAQQLFRMLRDRDRDRDNA